MKLYELTDDYSVLDALRDFGISAGEFNRLTPEELKKLWKKKIVDLHNYGKATDQALALLNRSYDILKTDKSKYHKIDPLTPEPVTRSNPTVPDWQPDKNSFKNIIQINTYRDPNYIKKYMWELSGKSDVIYTLEAFGDNTFQGEIKVYGSPKIYSEMAQAMLVYNTNGGKLHKTRAIFAIEQNSNTLNLIYSDGRSFAEKPVPIEFNGTDFRKDEDFKEKIILILDKIKSLYK